MPLRIGGGTRLKIYEAMAAKTAVVSTAIGAEGLDIAPGENILIADEPGAFAEACVRLISDQGERRRVADAAWKDVERQRLRSSRGRWGDDRVVASLRWHECQRGTQSVCATTCEV